MGKRSAAVEVLVGNMGSIRREIRPSMQREDQPTMATKLEHIAAKARSKTATATEAAAPTSGVASARSAVNQRPKSVVREIRTPRSVGTGGGLAAPGDPVGEETE
jgi:RNA-directed DNA polymerase